MHTVIISIMLLMLESTLLSRLLREYVLYKTNCFDDNHYQVAM